MDISASAIITAIYGDIVASAPKPSDARSGLSAKSSPMVYAATATPNGCQ